MRNIGCKCVYNISIKNCRSNNVAVGMRDAQVPIEYGYRYE